MEFEIDVHATSEGTIVITDLSKDYGQYLDEDINEIIYDIYKYSECCTLNAIVKTKTNTITVIDILLDDHSNDIDSSTFKVHEDGYYVIDHIVLPTTEWLQKQYKSVVEHFDVIYVTDGDKIYKYINQELQECTVREIMEVNPENTTIKRCKLDVIYVGNLQRCYFNYCNEIFNKSLNKCTIISDEVTYARDFIWMTLNIIDYLVCKKQYLEAGRIIENFESCNSFCKSSKTKIFNNCGCS